MDAVGADGEEEDEVLEGWQERRLRTAARAASRRPGRVTGTSIGASVYCPQRPIG